MSVNQSDFFIRGVARDNSDFITKEGYPTQGVFHFDKYDEQVRSDDYCELSINWLKDVEAVEILLTQRNKKGDLQFQGGYCKISLSYMILLLENCISKQYLSYEEQPVSGNPYHGNILMKKDISSQLKTNIQASLATLSGVVIRREKKVE